MNGKTNRTNWFLIGLCIICISSSLYFYNENRQIQNKITEFLGAAKAMEAENLQLRNFALEQKEKIDFLENLNFADSTNKKLRAESNLPATPEEENSSLPEAPSFKDLNKKQP